MIDLAIVGYGKMGKMIESIIDPDEFRLTAKFDLANPANEHMKNKPDVAFEFSTPASVIGNIEFLASKGVNIVCGTTGWYDKTESVKAIVDKYGTGLVYASNFSVGVNIFFRIVKEAAKLINKYPGYNIDIEETHHIQKLDKPSGTAIRIADFLIESISRKDKFSSDDPSPAEESINIISKRIENIVGNHRVILDSDADSIVLEHNAKSRRGFAEGALLAAKYIHGKKGFYRFEDIFTTI